MSRNRPSNRRESITTKAKTKFGSVFVTVGYADGKPVEVFADVFKIGAELKEFHAALCQSISLGLQHGIDPHEFTHSLKGVNEVIDVALRAIDDRFDEEDDGPKVDCERIQPPPIRKAGNMVTA